MNKTELMNLLNNLYPKAMLHDAKVNEKEASKHLAIKPNKAYQNIPMALKLFKSELCVMSNPTLSLESVRHELANWNSMLKDLKHVHHEIQKPNTYLDKSTYTPYYFHETSLYIHKNIKETKHFAKTLKSVNQLYYTQADDLSNEIHRKPLSKNLVIKTVKYVIFQYNHFTEETSNGYIVGLEDLATMPKYMKKDGIKLADIE